ncbi:MAG: hypothetical protein AMXMBFR44_5910 [Candidatus Campbellbacteria bacterium]
MKKNCFKNLLAYLFTFFLPIVSLAQNPSTIKNPLEGKGIDDIPALITVIVGAVMTIGYYIVVVFIIYAGFLFVTARGDEKKLGDAKKTFLYTVIGATILLGASILSTVIKNTVTQVGGQQSSIVEYHV